ncbi:MAG: hypothetical protein CM15mP23_15150 [Cryomorphaceae bacterium]|nr:MAG: hypothetical protein CM15mP23_15150 [Cryomorphaceae bacterium]
MKILLIYTGGTIGMVHDSESNAYVPFDFENLQSQIPELQHLDCILEVQSYEPSIDSSNMQPKIWAQLVETIEKFYEALMALLFYMVQILWLTQHQRLALCWKI